MGFFDKANRFLDTWVHNAAYAYHIDNGSTPEEAVRKILDVVHGRKPFCVLAPADLDDLARLLGSLPDPRKALASIILYVDKNRDASWLADPAIREEMTRRYAESQRLQPSGAK